MDVLRRIYQTIRDCVRQICSSSSHEERRRLINQEQMMNYSSVMDPATANVPQTSTSTADPIERQNISNSNVTNPGAEILSQSVVATINPGNTDNDGDLKLSDSQIEGLAGEIEPKNLESIAIYDLGIAIETVNNSKVIHQNDYIALNRDLLVLWRNKNPGINQVEVSKSLEKDVTG